MARLNATIKLLFCWGELFFLLVALLCLGASGLVVSGNIAALQFDGAIKMARLVLLLSASALVCTCYGCCGAFRQTFRKGLCSGRKMLCLHQLLLVTVLLFSLSQYEWLNKREQSVKLVLSDSESYREYDAFERRISKYFNNAYFDSICEAKTSSADQSTTWLMKFVDKRCSDDMGQEYCALSNYQKRTCDTSCAALRGLNFTTLDLLKCCPSEDLCADGNLSSCPYERCRVPILQELHAWTAPTKVATQFVIALAALMLILSCLLICFNPRDEIEMELLKTGVMSQEDVEAIQKLKDSHNVVTKRKSRVDIDTIDRLKDDQKKNKFGYSRKRTNRVSPTNV